MTTQPETAVESGVAMPDGTAAELTIEERFASHAADMFEDDEQETAHEEGEAENAELEAGEEEEGELEAGEPAPIKPPVSLTAEEKEAFEGWPRDAQETFTRRIGELEKGFQTKSQEAARVRSEVETSAIAEVQTLAQAHAQRLYSLLPQIPEKPSPYLQVSDPVAWAEQQDAHDWALAQHQAVQQEIEGANALAHNAEQEHARRVNAASVAILNEQFPEYLDPVKGPQHRQELAAVATELGFTSAELANPDARDILALRQVAALKTKADKYDKLMARQMETVRNAKQLPKVSKPGQPQAQGAVSAKRLEADRIAMRSGNMDAASRVFGSFL